MFPSWVIVCKVSKKVFGFGVFYTILCWPQQKSKSVEAIYIYASKSFCYALSENGMVYSHRPEVLAIKISTKKKKNADTVEI